MDKNEILSKVDHTLLKQEATWDDIKLICDQAIKYKTASVCIPPAFVKEAKLYVKDKMKVCTVIGFPNGYNTTQTKVYETLNAIENGADEIDMVINIGKLKEKDFSYIENEIKEIKDVCNGKVLKVIIETCLLADDEKVEMCKIVNKVGDIFIKTSTGFSKAGATIDDIKLFAKNINKEKVKIKAAGGINSFEEAQEFINQGADRLGTSRLVKIMEKK